MQTGLHTWLVNGRVPLPAIEAGCSPNTVCLRASEMSACVQQCTQAEQLTQLADLTQPGLSLRQVLHTIAFQVHQTTAAITLQPSQHDISLAWQLPSKSRPAARQPSQLSWQNNPRTAPHMRLRNQHRQAACHLKALVTQQGA